MSSKHKLCGNCFSPVKGKKCSNCGYTEDDTSSVYDVLPVGTDLNDRYIIGKLLGRGGFGITYLAYDRRDDKAVAVKEYYPDKTAVRSHNNITVEPMTTFQTKDFSDGLERFFSEAAIIMQFRESSDIMGLYDVFRTNGTAYYAMEFFNGVPLKSYVEKKGLLTEGQAVYIAEKLLPALSVIHGGGVLHRDISPDNIILCSNGRVKLVDFGSARVMSDDGNQSMSVILKEGFAPLEQYQRKGNQSSRTDIYSLAMSLYFGLTGIIPENPIIRMDDDSELKKGLEKISPNLAAIIEKAAAVKENDRYASDEDMLADIRSCGITSETTEVGELSEPVINPPKIKKGRLSRRQKLVIGIPASAAAIAAAIGVFFGMSPDDIEVKIGGEMYPISTTRIEMQNRELTNAQIANLKHLKDLQYLNLTDNYITDLSCLDGLTNIEYLYFNNNNVSDISFARSMNKLKKISGENNSVSDISALEGKKDLEEVFFGDNLVTDISPLAGCDKLKKAGFNEAQIGTVDALAGKIELEMVCLAGCHLESIEPFRGCDKLKYVYLGRNSLTDLSPLAGCNIQEFYIDNNRLSGHTDTFKGITLNGFVCMEGNGFTEAEIQDIIDNMDGEFSVYY
ncbi:MAG: protein kinase [Oscillospiraceae bacterium]